MWVSLMCYSVLLPSDELRVGTRHPADAISEGNSKPAICGSSDVLKGCARSNRGQSGVLCAIARANIDLAAFRDDHDTLTSGHRRFRDRVCLGRILPAFIVIRDGIHQRSMGFAAILAILQDLLILLEIKNGGFRFRPERTIRAVLWQTVL